MKTHKPKTIAEVSPKKLRERCDFMLTYLLGVENIEKWWSSPNMAFDGKTAKEYFETDPYEVYYYLLRFTESGGSY